MQVAFSEIALAGLRRELPNESQRQSLIIAIKFYLRRDHERLSEPCPAFEDIRLFLYQLSKFRILYQAEDGLVFVWSVRSGR